MRSLICTFLFAAILSAGCRRPGSSAETDSTATEKAVKDASSDGSIPTRTGIASSPDSRSEYASVRDGEKAQATFSGGDGSSIEHAVVVTASSEKTGHRAAYIWLRERYPSSRLLNESFAFNGDRYYNEIKIATADGGSRTVFFETTSFFGK